MPDIGSRLAEPEINSYRRGTVSAGRRLAHPRDRNGKRPGALWPERRIAQAEPRG